MIYTSHEITISCTNILYVLETFMRAVGSREMSAAQTRIVQISDMHVFADKEAALLGVKTYESLSALVHLLKNDPRPPDVIILSGDLSQDRSEASYQNIVDIFQDFKIPIYYFPGNHDDGLLMARFFPQGSISSVKNVLLGEWQLILLDSQKYGAVEGYLPDLQLEFMQECLRNYPGHHAIVALHHQPVPVGCEWVDNLGLKNADTFWDIIKQYPQVKNVLFGHVHQEFVGHKNGVNLYCTPSTCIQFKPKIPTFALDNLPPAYRWIDLKEHGELVTGIVRCAEYIGTFDPTAKGY
jgi:Icc protein